MKKRLNFLCVLLLVFFIAESIYPFFILPLCSREELGIPHYNVHDISYIELIVLLLGLIFLIFLFVASFIKFIKFILNINKEKVFVKENIPLLRWIGCSYIYVFIFSIYFNCIVDCDEWVGEWFDALVQGMFYLIIAEAFAIGIKLREEQELTI